MKNLMLITTLLTILAVPAFAAECAQTKLVANVNGLVCDFCAQTLERNIGKKEGVESVSVNLDTKKVDVVLKEGAKLEHDLLTKWITDSGYDVVAINHACNK